MFTIRNLTELASHFSQKAKEMNEIAQQRTGLAKHSYSGMAHAYNDAAITIRNCQMGRGKSKSQLEEKSE
jgi:hypothetical protein